jgi:opacity protein-like surface antigen
MRCMWLVAGHAAAALWLGTGAAAGQSTVPTHKWEIEVHGGGMLATAPMDGTGALPGPGPAITTPFTIPAGVSTGRLVSSWYFGDGASLLNQAASSFRLGGHITPLDPVLESPFVRRESGGDLGLRVGRVLTDRLAAEISFDYSLGTLALTSASVAGLEASRTGFAAAWNAVLTGPSQGTQTVSSVAAISDRRGRQLVTAGSVLINVMPPGRLTPYVALGAGMISNRNTPPSAVLVGDYQFSLVLVLPPNIPVPLALPRFHETDTVTVRSSVGSAATWIAGGGLKYALTDRWGVRIDVRDHVNANTISTLVDATPASTVLLPRSVLTLGTNPLLQFSTLPGAPSSLSGVPITSFKTFTGTGIEHHVNLTTGLFWRF